ncbi:Uncharacterised protein [Lysinibacillus capsici]|uniref:Uncharacterized protein n=1 Tax=Lysinibacillus capsici TaxID=2115968 RepID=A0A2X1A6W2_9BACI|nr:hypothetical protein [Lysinibacillus capsici]SPU40743.1 Uncharacterised protein [Lysinibacillus capsici]
MFKKLFSKHDPDNNNESNYSFDNDIPQRGERAAEKLLGNNKNPSDREEIIAKSKALVEGHKMELKIGPNVEGHKTGLKIGPNNNNPIIPNNLEISVPKRNVTQPLPVIEINNNKEFVEEEEHIDSTYITPDEKFYTEPNAKTKPVEYELEDQQGITEEDYDDIPSDQVRTSDEQATEDDRNFDEILAALEAEPFGETERILKGNVKSSTTVRVVYDEYGRLENRIYNFDIPLSKFIENYDMEIASLGYSTAIDEEGKQVTINPSLCCTIEIY